MRTRDKGKRRSPRSKTPLSRKTLRRNFLSESDEETCDSLGMHWVLGDREARLSAIASHQAGMALIIRSASLDHAMEIKIKC